MEETTRLLDLLSEQSNSTTADLRVVALSFILAFVLAVLLVIIYQVTTPQGKQNRQFLQALILLSLVAAMIMMAIGNNIARGLGILGALSIIRFRTNIRNPRNITFTFASLAAGLACGIHGFAVAIIGTVSFSLVALFLRLSWFGRPRELQGIVKIEAIHTENRVAELLLILSKLCRSAELTEMKHLIRPAKETSPAEDGLLRKSFTFQVWLKEQVDSAELNRQLVELAGVERVFFEQTTVDDDV